MSNEQVHALLVQARETISDPARWHQGAFARGSHGLAVKPDDPAAVAWCAMGALRMHHPTWDSVLVKADDALNAAAWRMRAYSVRMEPAACVNDRRGHAATIEMFDRAIAATAPAEVQG